MVKKEGGVVRIEGCVVKKCKTVVKTLKTVVKINCIMANPASSTINAVWTAAELQQFAARGGVASAIPTAVSMASDVASQRRRCRPGSGSVRRAR